MARYLSGVAVFHSAIVFRDVVQSQEDVDWLVTFLEDEWGWSHGVPASVTEARSAAASWTCEREVLPMGLRLLDREPEVPTDDSLPDDDESMLVGVPVPEVDR